MHAYTWTHNEGSKQASAFCNISCINDTTYVRIYIHAGGQSKLRRVREYEAEDLEIRRATASGLWNKQMHPDATMDTEEKTEIRKLTDALKGQVIFF